MNLQQNLELTIPSHKNTMPKLIPVPIETNGKNFFEALWIWVKSTREWEFESDWDFNYSDNGPIVVIPKKFVFDGASIPKMFRSTLSPVGLLLVPGIVHDFGYRYDYVWIRKNDGSVEKSYEKSGRKFWDKLFFTVGKRVNGIFIINFLAWFALTFAGWIAWNGNRGKNYPELKPKKIMVDVSRMESESSHKEER